MVEVIIMDLVVQVEEEEVVDLHSLMVHKL